MPIEPVRLALFPGPSQLSFPCGMVVLQATKTWAVACEQGYCVRQQGSMQLHSTCNYFPLVRLHVREQSGAGQLSVQSCCSPIAAAAPRLRPLQLLLPDCIDPLQLHAVPCLRPLQLLLAACVRFSCCSSIASASATAHHLHPLQPVASTSTAPWLRPLRLLLPDCDHFDCCFLIASACNPSCCSPCPMFSNILRGVRGSVNQSATVVCH